MASGTTVSVNIDTKSFGSDSLFSGLTLDVPEGEVLTLFGPSGVGKSTLLRMIAGIDRDFEGSIRVGGQSPSNAPLPGFVFQDPRLLPWETALGNLTAVCPGLTETLGMELLSAVGLDGAEHLRPAELSGGMQRRVSLARALAVSPRLLLLDEPFVSIDRKLARELRALLLRVVDDFAPTLILVTHDPFDAAHLADRVVSLHGRPARIVHDRKLDGPRGRRDTDAILAIARQLDSEAEL